MGFRNPFRVTLDENDVAYVSDYSPDSQTPAALPRTAGHRPVRDRPQAGELRLAALLQDRPGVLQVGLRTRAPLADSAAPEPHDCDNPSAGRRTPPAGSRTAARQSSPGSSSDATDHPAGDLVLVPGQPGRTPAGHAVLRAYGPNGATRHPVGVACPRLFPELFTGASAPTATAPYDYDPATRTRRSSRRTGTERSSSASSRRTRCARSDSTRRTASSRSTTRCPAARHRRPPPAVPVRQPDGHGVRARTATSTCSPTATASSPSTRRSDGAVRVRQGPSGPARVDLRNHRRAARRR